MSKKRKKKRKSRKKLVIVVCQKENTVDPEAFNLDGIKNKFVHPDYQD